MADTLQVDLVSADRVTWSGEATFVVARTTDGEIGVLPNHSPVLSVLTPGGVEVVTADGNERLHMVIDGGFLSVAHNRVSVLSGRVEPASEIDAAEARRELEEARAAADDSPEADERLRIAEARAQAVEKAP